MVYDMGYQISVDGKDDDYQNEFLNYQSFVMMPNPTCAQSKSRSRQMPAVAHGIG